MKTKNFILVTASIIGLSLLLTIKISAQVVMVGEPTRPLTFVKEIEIPGSDSLETFSPKKTFSSESKDNPIAKFRFSDSYNDLFLKTAKIVSPNQPSIQLLIYASTGNIGDEEIDLILTKGTPLSEIEYSHVLKYIIVNKPELIERCGNFVVGNDKEHVYLSAVFDSFGDKDWLLVGNTNMSHGPGLLVFLKKK